MAAAASSESDGSRGAGSASARLDGADARATLALTPAEVAELLVTKPERIAVVDVREMDFDGGHIASALNVPSFRFEDELPSLAAKLQGKDLAIVHCMQSRVRGPACAERLRRHLEARGAQTPRVALMTGGFHGWMLYWRDRRRDDKFRALVKDYDRKLWEEPESEDDEADST